MFVSRPLSRLLTRASSTHRTRRRRRLSLVGLGDWLLENRFLLSAAPSSMTSGLSLASGQTDIIDVSKTPVLNLNGNLNDQGTIYLVSTNPLVRSVSVEATNIVVGAGGQITTVLPPSGLPGYSNAIDNLSLKLVAAHNIVDAGVVASANALIAQAGRRFSNQAVLSTSGTGAGGNAKDITIIADSIEVDEPLLAVGSNGSNGSDATQQGQSGAPGGNGGNGGMITLEATDPKGKGITIKANIQADGGNGGNGGAVPAAMPRTQMGARADGVATAAWPDPSASRRRVLPSSRQRGS